MVAAERASTTDEELVTDVMRGCNAQRVTISFVPGNYRKLHDNANDPVMIWYVHYRQR